MSIKRAANGNDDDGIFHLLQHLFERPFKSAVIPLFQVLSHVSIAF